MGNTCAVEVWKESQYRAGEYSYEEFWRGQSAIAAIYNFIRAKQAGYGCVALKWR